MIEADAAGSLPKNDGQRGRISMKRTVSGFTLAGMLLSGLQFATVDIAEAKGAAPDRTKPIALVRVVKRNSVAGKIPGGESKGIVIIDNQPSNEPTQDITIERWHMESYIMSGED